jgi:hypothetical protein
MVGLWGPNTVYGPQSGIDRKCHVAFAISLDELFAMIKRLSQQGIETFGFGGGKSEEPTVIGWMPSAQIYFRDPDGHMVEFISLLPGDPRPRFRGRLLGVAEASRKVSDSLVVKESRRHRWLSAFFGFGTAMCALTIMLLLFLATKFDLLWRLNPDARLAFQSLGSWSFVIMTIVGVACGAAAIGLWRGNVWGARLAMIILSVNIVGDLINVFSRHDYRALIGLPIGGAIIVYLARYRSLGHWLSLKNNSVAQGRALRHIGMDDKATQIATRYKCQSSEDRSHFDRRGKSRGIQQEPECGRARSFGRPQRWKSSCQKVVSEAASRNWSSRSRQTVGQTKVISIDIDSKKRPNEVGGGSIPLTGLLLRGFRIIFLTASVQPAQNNFTPKRI